MQSSKARNQIQEDKEEEIKALSVEKLQQQFSSLQQDWEIFKMSNPRTRSQYRYSNNATTRCYSSSSSNNVVKTLDYHLFDKTSPRNLMSALQSNNDNNVVDHRCLVMSITRTSDSEVRETVRDRRKAIESGSLKGRRRLFESCDDDDDGDDSDVIGLVDQDNNKTNSVHEVGSVVSFDESEGENDEIVDDGVDHDVNEAVLVRRYSCSQVVLEEIRREEMIGKRLLSQCNVLLIVLIFIVFAICIFGQFDIGEREMILVPT